MTIRRHQLDTVPEPIHEEPAARERIAVLRVLAKRLPQIAARAQVRVVGKGGTLLRLCEGLPRPSTDYDCDTSTRWSDAAQARAIRQALRDLPDVGDLDVVEPISRNQPVRFSWTSRLPDGSTERIHSFINSKIVPDLDDARFRAQHLRIHEGITTYRPQHLFQGKADAFCNRSAGRDLYDVWYGLSHCVDRIEPSTRIQLYEHTNQMTQLLIDEWNTDLADDSVLRGQVEAEDMLEGIMECLEKDPVVALHANPQRSLGFLVDSEASTISLGLRPTDDDDFHPIYTRPQTHAKDVAAFALACQTPIWEILGVPRPSGGVGPENSVLTEIINDNIEHYNARAAERGIEG